MLDAIGTAPLLWIVFAAVGGYLLGSIPFGLILTRAAGLGDIRAIGSGNIGATNVLRTGRKGLAAATLLLDALKGAAAVWIAGAVAPDLAVWAGGGAMVGHAFPVWLGFKGGKGVATALGVLAAAAWPLALFAAALWLASAVLLRISSLAALIATAATATAAWIGALAPQAWLPDSSVPLAWLVTLIAILIFIRHHANIRRLLKGEEPRIGAKKKAA